MGKKNKKPRRQITHFSSKKTVEFRGTPAEHREGLQHYAEHAERKVSATRRHIDAGACTQALGTFDLATRLAGKVEAEYMSIPKAGGNDKYLYTRTREEHARLLARMHACLKGR